MNTYQTAEEQYGFDFSEEWDWEMLQTRVAETDGLDDLATLRGLASLDDARFLFMQLTRLDEPDEIRRLADYQRLQEEWGGSFHGMLPEPLGRRELPIPADLPSLIRAALLIARARKENIEALKKTIPTYPIEFERNPFPTTEVTPPPGWTLEIDLSAIHGILDLFAKEQVTREEAAAVAALPAFEEMMRHRRELGYIPEPLITEEGLSRFLYHATSREPLDMIWKWLTPQNFFDLADLFFHQEGYAALIETLSSHAGEINSYILGTIGRYAPLGVVFHDRLAFTVGWGIAGWATTTTGGINIEHFKDDYDRLLLTLAHETFHRFQLQVCPTDPSSNEQERSFETLTCFPFESTLDRKFYEILTYIFLEGTATFVAAAHPPVDREGSIRQGAHLLAECFDAIYQKKDLDRAEELLNEGLKSNGPFYWLGAYIAETIVKREGVPVLAASLTEGSPAFFGRYLSIKIPEELRLGRTVEDKVQELAAIMRKEA